VPGLVTSLPAVWAPLALVSWEPELVTSPAWAQRAPALQAAERVGPPVRSARTHARVA